MPHPQLRRGAQRSALRLLRGRQNSRSPLSRPPQHAAAQCLPAPSNWAECEALAERYYPSAFCHKVQALCRALATVADCGI